MSSYEATSLIVSTISAIIALVAVIVSIISYRKASSAASANIEIYLNERITNTKERVDDISRQLKPLINRKKTAKDEEQFEFLVLSFRTAVENNLNAYEEACAKYLDKKVDRKRFRQIYKLEIRKLVENQEFKEYFDGITPRYSAILQVYNQWEKAD